jgi:hypothetical protein
MREARGMGYGQSSVIALVLAAKRRERDFRYLPRLRADTPVSPYTTPVSPDTTRDQACPACQRVMREARGMGYGQSAVIALVLGTTHRWRPYRYFLRLRADTPVSPYTMPVGPTATRDQACPGCQRVMREARDIGYGQSSVIALVLAATRRWRHYRYFPRLRADTSVSPYAMPVSPYTMPVGPDTTPVSPYVLRCPELWQRER